MIDTSHHSVATLEMDDGCTVFLVVSINGTRFEGKAVVKRKDGRVVPRIVRTDATSLEALQAAITKEARMAQYEP